MLHLDSRGAIAGPSEHEASVQESDANLHSAELALLKATEDACDGPFSYAVLVDEASYLVIKSLKARAYV